MTRDAVLEEALRLTPQERADVAAELLESLEAERLDRREDVERAWAEEIERRARRVLAGESTGAPWDEVRRRLEERLARR
jgi:putative addiction module component (TIGR02574 family)